MERPAFVAACDALFTPTQRDNGASQKLLEILAVKSVSDLPQVIQDTPAAIEIRDLLELLEASGVTNAEFDITIMRGFDYYTGIVFEMMDTDPENNRAMFGGGRYDGLVGLFGVEPVQTVGFGWGDVTIANFLETHDLLPKLTSETEVYAILIGDVYNEAQRLLATLRSEGVTIAVDSSGRKLASQLKNAVKKDIRFALFIGEDELKTGQFNLKDLLRGEELKLSAERVVSTVLDSRRQK